MAFADPASIDLGALFRDPDMFDSRRSWSDAGFRVIDRDSNGKIMVGQHPALPGILFKKYTDDVDEKDQTRNFERRLEGSNRLRTFTAAHRLQHVAVPRKWIRELPRAFGRSAHILVVDRFEVLSDAQTKSAYRTIAPAVLKDLCIVLFHFRGMDSIAKNLPFTADGRIGLIDTEHWDRSTSNRYLHRIGEHLSKDRRSLAKSFLEQIDEGDVVDVGDESDFSDEEDTSSSSSSSSSS